MELHVDRLTAGLKFVLHAAAKDMARPILATVLLEGTPKGLVLVAADNYRIARARVSDEDCADFGRRSLSRDEVPVVLAFLKGETKVTLEPLGTMSSPAVVWSVGLARNLQTRCVDGTWPNYVKVIPKQIKKTLVAVNPRYLADALAAAGKAGIIARVFAPSANEPVLVVTNDGDNEYLEAVMPVRTSGTTSDEYAWIDRLQAEAER